MASRKKKKPFKPPRKKAASRKAVSKVFGTLPLPSERPSAAYPSSVSPLQRLEKQLSRSLDRPKVSVVIVNRNGVDDLWHCLFALKTQTYPAFEILLVDNGSSDASLSFVRSNYPQVKILECQEDFGFIMGFNLGAKTAEGDLVAFLGMTRW